MKKTATPKHTPRGADNIGALVKALDAGYRYRPHEMMGFFLSGLFKLWGLPEWQSVPEDAQEKIAGAIGVYSDLVKEAPPFYDLLGPVYMELASHGARQQMAQYFTPWPVAAMMSLMTMGDSLPEKEDGLVTACDPCCGSGVMMLAFANAVHQAHGVEGLRRLSLTGCDLDPYCARMMAAQMIASCNVHDVQLGEVVILRGNSLLPWKEMELILHATSPDLPDLAIAPALSVERLAALSSAAKAHPDAVQLDLFDYMEEKVAA